jgi:hypothetical protein
MRLSARVIIGYAAADRFEQYQVAISTMLLMLQPTDSSRCAAARAGTDRHPNKPGRVPGTMVGFQEGRFFLISASVKAKAGSREGRSDRRGSAEPMTEQSRLG